ncbi:hypothetical protein BASA81_001879 [Batrachochytrium salamandrivorans]|nr:hypothetical protein BASA81_001879 [Batrachochytrium salamandrivorans]
MVKSLLSSQGHFKWLEKKRILKQDVLLLSPPPSTFSRRLITEFASVHKIPFEYQSLSIDTSESDLKTRKELFKQQVLFADQAPVRAALEGKMLILDGLEKCERNVLPTLNNLLENREINLDDGRHLVSYQRYQHLLKSSSNTQLQQLGIYPCHPDFFVVALTCPVPKFQGRPLDPPLRSRFQVRLVEFPTSAKEVLTAWPLVDPSALEFILTVNSISSTTNAELRGKRIPEMNLIPLSKSLANGNPNKSSVYSRYFPWLQDTPHLLGLFPDLANQSQALPLPKHATLPPSRMQVLQSLLDDHLVANRDVLVCGAAGSGKSFLANEFAKAIDRNLVIFPLYRDMTSRDLIATRRIENGDSIWEHSVLVRAAKEGNVLVLDGLEKLDSTVLGVLSTLCEERELWFLNGERIVVHPNFRIVALATASTKHKTKLFTSEVLGMFSVHQIEPFSMEEIQHLAGRQSSDSKEAKQLFAFAAELDRAGELLPTSTRLSLRSCLRILQRMERGALPLVDQIKRALLEPFLSTSQRELIGKLLQKSGLKPSSSPNHSTSNNTDITTNDTVLQIGHISVNRFPNQSRPELVPKVTFFDVPHHRATLQAMLVDFSIGARNLLLIGNQGVGKNKVADRLLELLNLEREYIQLHRDSSVQSLAGTPTLANGQLVFEDSPLVRAAKFGRCVLVDEADKAPPEVVSVLKSLVEDNGEILLGDGQRLVRRRANPELGEIQIHKDFCVWILSNRGGFPFQGNSFVDQIGDVFAIHVVSNPDFDSELSMLESYAPRTDKRILKQLCLCFADLRQLSDEGLLNYPYSTREAVHVARHLESFPEDGLVEALHNVLDFDAYNTEESLQLVLKVFHSHNIPFDFTNRIAATAGLGANLGKTETIPALRPSGEVWWKKKEI